MDDVGDPTALPGLLDQIGGASAYFFANPVVGIGPVRLTPLICYEQLIVWPVLQSMLSDPEMIVAVGNGWWTADTNIVAIQRASASAWARLFSKPLILSPRPTNIQKLVRTRYAILV